MMHSQIDTKWFREKLAEKRLSQRGLARYLGLDSAAVSLMLRGKRLVKIEEAKQIALLLGVTVDEVLQHIETPVVSVSTPIPIIGVMGGDASVQWCDDGNLGTVPRPTGDLPLRMAAVQCRTYGTDLGYMDRWLLFIPYPLPEGVAAECIDRLSVVCSQDQRCSVAQVIRGYAPGKWSLRGPMSHADEVDLAYAVPVLLIGT